MVRAEASGTSRAPFPVARTRMRRPQRWSPSPPHSMSRCVYTHGPRTRSHPVRRQRARRDPRCCCVPSTVVAGARARSSDEWHASSTTPDSSGRVVVCAVPVDVPRAPRLVHKGPFRRQMRILPETAGTDGSGRRGPWYGAAPHSQDAAHKTSSVRSENVSTARSYSPGPPYRAHRRGESANAARQVLNTRLAQVRLVSRKEVVPGSRGRVACSYPRYVAQCCFLCRVVPPGRAFDTLRACWMGFASGLWTAAARRGDGRCGVRKRRTPDDVDQRREHGRRRPNRECDCGSPRPPAACCPRRLALASPPQCANVAGAFEARRECSVCAKKRPRCRPGCAKRAKTRSDHMLCLRRAPPACVIYACTDALPVCDLCLQRRSTCALCLYRRSTCDLCLQRRSTCALCLYRRSICALCLYTRPVSVFASGTSATHSPR